jgi:hypothetical protein
MYITYNNLGHTDGAGAQLQRIISIYKIAKYYNIGYIHTGIKHLDNQGVTHIENNSVDESQIDLYNNLFYIQGDKPDTSDYISIFLDSPTIEDLKSYIVSGENVILYITHSHVIIDSNADILNIPLKFQWSETTIKFPLKIAVHIRRGDLFVVESHRMLPNSYYTHCMKSLEGIFTHANIPYEFHIYSEMFSSTVDVSRYVSKYYSKNIDHPVFVNLDDFNLEDFKAFNNVVFHINECPVKCLIEMSNADVLVSSKSSYSYTASIINQKGIIIFPPFWHSMKQSWISAYSGDDIVNNRQKILNKFRRIISFSLWGDNPKYTIGAIRNAELAKLYYPGWICRFYIGKSTPEEIIQKLESFDNTEVLRMNLDGDLSGTFWRFYSIFDTEYSIMICRDTDSRLSTREKYAVDEWASSEFGFHIMRDHPCHGNLIMAGMWGIKHDVIPNFKDLIISFDRRSENIRGTDQIFLWEKVYPVIKNNCMVHDEIFNINEVRRNFPSPRIDYEFVGDVFDSNDVRDPTFWKMFKM